MTCEAMVWSQGRRCSRLATRPVESKPLGFCKWVAPSTASRSRHTSSIAPGDRSDERVTNLVILRSGLDYWVAGPRGVREGDTSRRPDVATGVSLTSLVIMLIAFPAARDDWSER